MDDDWEILVGGIPTPLKNDGVKVSWDEIPIYMESHKSHVPNHQPENDVVPNVMIQSTRTCGYLFLPSGVQVGGS
jgi:hypothetical protein